MFVVLLFVIILGMGYKTIIVPAKEGLAKNQNALEQNRAASTTLHEQKNRIDKQVDKKDPKQNAQNVARALPPTIRFDTELLRLEPLMRSSGVRDQSISPGKETIGSPVSGFAISITITGSLNNTIKFLRTLRRQVTIEKNQINATGPIWVITSVNIGGSTDAGEAPSGGGKGTGTLEAFILFKSPQQPKKPETEESKAPPTGASPPSTP